MNTIAVIFGGESVEHDVSILTAIQFMNAMDQERYSPLPVYVDPKGRWWTGPRLRERSFYPLTRDNDKDLTRVRLPGESLRGKQAYFSTPSRGLFSKPKTIPFDLMVPAIHGSNGEDGSLQGYLDLIGVPYAGCDTLAAAATMDKDFTKRAVAASGVPVLDHLVLEKPGAGKPLKVKAITATLIKKFGQNPFPLIVKPCHLGSSIGVTPAHNVDDLMVGLSLCFRLDYKVVIEPLIRQLAEYNVAVSKVFGATTASVIEKPVKASEFLDFKGKYLAGDEAGAKLKTGNSEGMASLNRVIDPDGLSKKKKEMIRAWACTVFDALGLAGSVRIDFLGDEKTGELWLNEINTVPGSFAFYLWQESAPPVSFTNLTSALIEEGFQRAEHRLTETDKHLGGGVIFKEK